MSKEQEIVEKLLSFAFAMSENMIGLTKGNYDENTFIKKTYEYLQKYNIGRDEQKTIKRSMERLEAIDNSEPSEALECLKELHELAYGFDGWKIDEIVQSSYIKQALLKTQEQKQYLKWEDLKFTKKAKEMLVKLGDTTYTMRYYKVNDHTNKVCISSFQPIEIYDIRFFNDLHLERVE